jgi:branched-chain amino acid transport system ATP-binding protein
MERVTAGYGGTVVLRDVSLHVGEGEIVALLGRNGVGKSTLLKTAMGYLRPRSGSIAFAGAPAVGTPTHRLARRGIAYVPQERALFADLSVAENLRLGLPRDRVFAERAAEVGDIFPVLGRRMPQKAGTLSGGEQKMLLLARALIARPAVALVDEITEGLQPSVVERLVGVLGDARRARGTAMLLVEQNLRFALEVADRYVVMDNGELVAHGGCGDPGAAVAVERHLTV